MSNPYWPDTPTIHNTSVAITKGSTVYEKTTITSIALPGGGTIFTGTIDSSEVFGDVNDLDKVSVSINLSC